MEILLKYQKHFKEITSLYPYQAAVLEKLAQQKNTLAVIPTGGGKSLIYQLMSLDLKGITLVISPLIALMEEQVNELNNRRKIRALALNSNISFTDQREILRTLDDSYKLIYISPERLQNPFFRASLVASGIHVSMIVVDEAHCISQWGSSFRPDYGQIRDFFNFLKKEKHSPFVLSLTATLSLPARADIINEFEIEPENVVTEDIIRTNLKLNFQEVNNEDEKPGYLREFLKRYKPRKTVAYLYSKKKCEEYAREFSDKFKTDYYHAAIEPEEKDEAYGDFVTSITEILFATTAFGMGINIPDIEAVVHIQIPNSVEEYYQQVGRGWRDQTDLKDCNCLALWSEVNFDRRMKELQKEKYSSEIIAKAYKLLVGPKKIIGKVVNKSKDTLMNSKYNLQLLKYKLEKHGVIRTIGEINGSPLSIELNNNTEIWLKIRETAKEMDSFGFVSEKLGIPVKDIIAHLYEQDLKGNIKKLPAMEKDIYLELLTGEIPEEVASEIVLEINKEIDFRLRRLEELKDLFACDDKLGKLIELLT